MLCELWQGKGFRHDIGNLIVARNVNEFNGSVFNGLSNEVMADVNVSCSGMDGRVVVCEVNSRLIIAVDGCGSLDGKTEISEKSTDEDCLAGCTS